MYIAHYRKSDNIYQTIREHSINVSEYCKSFGKKLGATNISKLVGLIHDMGKMSDEFQEYITIAIEHEKKGTLKEWEKTYKKVDHGRVGGLYIYSTYHDMNGYAKITAEIISMIVCYHHGGLHDYITFDCKIPLVERFKRQGADVSYQQATTRFFKV